MPLTILVPRGAEEHAVCRAMPHATVIGIAAGAASSALPATLADGTFVVVIGLCGSLGERRVGDVVSYERVVDGDADESIDAGARARVSALVPAAHAVVACTTGHVVTRAAERRALAGRFGAAVVDMEGVSLARALRARGLPFAMVRVVSDDPRYDLPPIEHALAPDGAIRPLQLARAFVVAPIAFVRFVRDVQGSLRVLGGVAAALGAGEGTPLADGVK